MTRRLLTSILLMALAAAPAVALSPGETVIVPAAGRGAPWGTDLYVMNPGTATVDVTVYWLVRDQANTNPASFSFSLPGGDTEVLDDVILNDFGLSEGNGAFLVMADGGEVIVNSRIYASDGTATFGQGFEGVPDWAATQAGSATDVVGLSQNAGFRCNVYATAGETGAVINFSLRDPQGGVLASTALSLTVLGAATAARQPALPSSPTSTTDLHAEVTPAWRWSALQGRQRLTDQTHARSRRKTAAAGGIDGTYQFAPRLTCRCSVRRRIVISGAVEATVGTYFNWDQARGFRGRPLLFQGQA
jgi:hypothetical protein